MRNPLLAAALAAEPRWTRYSQMPFIGLKWLIYLRHRSYALKMFPFVSLLIVVSNWDPAAIPAKTKFIMAIWWVCWLIPSLFTDNASAFQFRWDMPETPALRRWRMHYDLMLIEQVEGSQWLGAYLLDCGHVSPIYERSPLEVGGVRPCSLHRQYPRQSTVIGLSFDPSRRYRLEPTSRH